MIMKQLFIFIAGLCFSISTKSQTVTLRNNTIELTTSKSDTAYKEVVLDSVVYVIKYVYSPQAYFTPATYPEGDPHYVANITVYKDTCYIAVDGLICKLIQVGEPMPGIYVAKGCYEDIPEGWVKKALITSKTKR